MQLTKYSQLTTDVYDLEITITAPAFNLEPGQSFLVEGDKLPRVGNIVAVLHDGQRRLGRYRKQCVELSDGTCAMKHTLTILGVIKLLMSVFINV